MAFQLVFSWGCFPNTAAPAVFHTHVLTPLLVCAPEWSCWVPVAGEGADCGAALPGPHTLPGWRATSYSGPIDMICGFPNFPLGLPGSWSWSWAQVGSCSCLGPNWASTGGQAWPCCVCAHPLCRAPLLVVFSWQHGSALLSPCCLT